MLLPLVTLTSTVMMDLIVISEQAEEGESRKSVPTVALNMLLLMRGRECP